MGQRIFMIAGFVVAFGAGYLAAAWQGKMLPWQVESRPAVSSVPGSSNLTGVFRAPPKQGPASQGGQPIPQTGALPPVPVGNPARQGDVLFAQRRFQEAIPFYLKAIEANPEDMGSRNDLGLALHYMGRSEEALIALRKGTEMAPRYQRIWLTLGFVAFQRQRLQEARLALERAVSINPANTIAVEARKFLKEIPPPAP